jgi:polyferredoxin
VLLVVYLGFLNGDMLSQALIVGWAQNGIPWRLGPGLVILSAAALLTPAVTKRQLYCHHICPYGAAQQLLRGRVSRRRRIARHWRRWLQLIPPVLLVLVVLTAMLHWPINLAGIEPFDAFLFWIAGTAALTIAVVGLAASALVPMAYCRFGCPTGAMLEYVRYQGQSDRFSRRDALAAGLLLLALGLS